MTTTLATALDGILTGVIEKLTAAKEEYGALEDVDEIIRGDRARPHPRVPTIWVYPDAATPTHVTSQQEAWTLPVMLVAVVKNDDPDKGYTAATDLAARARSVVLEGRGLESRDYVQDIVSGRFECSGPWYRDGVLFSAIAVVEVKFRILEQ